MITLGNKTCILAALDMPVTTCYRPAMPEPKYLWRVSVHRVPRPVYLVAQNIQSAAAQAAKHPQVEAADVGFLQRLDLWDDSQNMTVVPWPEPPPEPEPEPEPPP